MGADLARPRRSGRGRRGRRALARPVRHPPALAVADALADVGGPEPVRGGALADLVDRLEAAGHRSSAGRSPPAAARDVRALRREGAARFWLWRRRPDRHPLPRPAEVGLLAYRAHGDPTPCAPGVTRQAAARRARGEVVRPDEVERQRRAEAHAERLHALRHAPLVGAQERLARLGLTTVELGEVSRRARRLAPGEALGAAQVDEHPAALLRLRPQRLDETRAAVRALAHPGHGGKARSTGGRNRPAYWTVIVPVMPGWNSHR